MHSKFNLQSGMDGESSSRREISGTVPKPEPFDLQLPLGQYGSTVGSSSGSNVRSILLGMGFLPSLVEKAIKEKGEDNMDLLLETVLEYSASQKPNSESSDSLDDLFDDEYRSCPAEVSSTVEPKEEPDSADHVNDEKRRSLLMMNFSAKEVEFAMDKLGKDAPMNRLVDFIIAVQITVKFEKEGDNVANGNQDKKKELTDEILYGTMEKTLRLLEMGFTENQVSAAIDRLGSEVPLAELADSMFADQFTEKDKFYPSISRVKHEFTGVDGTSVGEGINGQRLHDNASGEVKMEEGSPGVLYQLNNIHRDTIYKGKRPKEEFGDGFPDSGPRVGHFAIEEIGAGKRPRQGYFNDLNPFSGVTSVEDTIDSKADSFGLPQQPNSSRPLDQMVTRRPYFFYGNVANISQDSWTKISQFLYAVKPEFANTQFFSALSRREGYIHNLPTENRFCICPKPPMTIEDAIPSVKKWWPPWDPRKQLNFINSEVTGISELCNRLARILYDSQGLLSPEQKRDILHHCQTKNLVWVGQYKLSAIEPEHLECILGYPPKHTDAAESSLVERLQSLKYCFQTDTLGYHLSALKSLFPNGVTVLSVFSGIGGAEIALHRLGINLRGVVSVEVSEMKRKILKRWWNKTKQVGELVQVEDIQKLTTTKLESLFERFGGFDLVICQNASSHSQASKIGAHSEGDVGFDFSLFYEFVRILQRVRNSMKRKP